MQPNSLAKTFLAFSVRQMQQSERQIFHCLNALTDEQIWHRGGEHENSIGNLLLHLEGNMRQWFLHGIDGQPDVRERDAEFALAPAVSSEEARLRLAATLAESCQVIGSLREERLLEMVNPQPTGNWGPMTILEAIYRIVGHLQMHTGQIILLTKQLAGRDLDLTIPRKR